MCPAWAMHLHWQQLYIYIHLNGSSIIIDACSKLTDIESLVGSTLE